jgi:glycosyltransferase involved in cell wall biosynthesis
MMAKALYLSYDGMCDPLGQSQVLPYLVGLARNGHRITLISFEKPERGADERASVASACAAAGIDWHPLRYHRRPPILSSIYDVRRMYRLAARLHRAKRFDLVHCRSYLPAQVGLKMKRRLGVPFIFDMRGFWADERIEGGGWPQSNPVYRGVYRYFKQLERDLWAEADVLVSLTDAARESIEAASPAHAPIAVIPCCAEFETFPPIDPERRKRARDLLGIGDHERVLGYIGSLGGNYMLPEMLDFFRLYARRNAAARFLFITHAPAELIEATADGQGISRSAIIIRSANRAEVALFMAAANEGIAFKQPSFSALACSPTKLGEMLAMELPVVTNSGVGDVEQVVEETGAGVIVRTFDDEAYRRALDALDQLSPNMNEWRGAARRWFDLDRGVESYDAVYRGIANGDVGSAGPVG